MYKLAEESGGEIRFASSQVQSPIIDKPSIMAKAEVSIDRLGLDRRDALAEPNRARLAARA